jgi:hypothetical protein
MRPRDARRAGVGLGLAVNYSLAVLNADGSVAGTRARKRNLILDSGLDLVASQMLANLFSVAVVGTSATPVKRDSGAITFTRAGNVVTASANFFEAADVNRLLKFDSGEEMYVTAFTDAQSVTVNVAGALAASEGTVWYVNQTGLLAEAKRTNVYGTDSGDNGTTFVAVSKTFVHKRTFIFSAEAAGVTYREIGWSHTATAGNNLFGRDSITGGIALAAGQQLKVVVELTVAISPNAPTAYANVIAGWSQNGTCGVESVPEPATSGRYIACVAASGATLQTNSNQVFEGASTPFCVLASGGEAIVAMGTAAVNVTGRIITKGAAPAAYVQGSRYRDKVASFTVAEANSANIRSLGITSDAFGDVRCFRVLLNAAETKDSEHTLTLTFRLSWGRQLVN